MPILDKSIHNKKISLILAVFFDYFLYLQRKLT